MSQGHRLGDLEDYSPDLLEYMAWLCRRRRAREGAQDDIGFASIVRVAILSAMDRAGAAAFKEMLGELRKAYEAAGGHKAEQVVEQRKRLATGKPGG